MLNLQQPSKGPNFEITMQVRDPNGNPTGKTKTFATDDGNKVYDFYMRNKGKPKRKNKRKKGKEADSNLPTSEQANQILKDMYQQDDSQINGQFRNPSN